MGANSSHLGTSKADAQRMTTVLVGLGGCLPLFIRDAVIEPMGLGENGKRYASFVPSRPTMHGDVTSEEGGWRAGYNAQRGLVATLGW